MKRTFAAVVLLAALGTLVKLAFKGESPRPRELVRSAAPEKPTTAPADPRPEILARYPDDRPMVARVLESYGHNAVLIERTDGLRGLVLLDRLGLEAVYLYDRRPTEFRKLRDGLTDDAAADILLHWREYFGLKAANDADREILINAIAGLSPSSRRIARKYPNVLPLLLAEPAGMAELIDGHQGDADDLRDVLTALMMISLEPGPTDLRAALRTFDQFGTLALEAFRLEGPDGLAIVHLYGSVLSALGGSVPLPDALVLLRVNAADVDRMLASRRPEAIANDLRHVSAGGRRLTEAVGGSPHGLRLLVEFGPKGEQALIQAGPDAADLVDGLYADADPLLRSQAVASLAEHGPMALALLAKYSEDNDFREIVRSYGPAVFPTVARADQAPETLAYLRGKTDRGRLETVAMGIQALEKDSGQAAIRRIRTDGLARAQSLDSTEVQAYQFLPLYDLVHLGGVLTRGHSPTSGEVTWALVDGCFVIADALSLITLQPEGAAAAELARAELKAAAREGARAAGRELVEEAAQAVGKAGTREATAEAAEQAVKWSAVRRAGGPFAILKRLPEALPNLDLPKLTELAGPLTQRAGLRLGSWSKPLRFLTRDGEKVLTLKPGAGLRFVRDQAIATTVGVVGYRKMEEYLKSRRPGGLGEPE